MSRHCPINHSKQISSQNSDLHDNLHLKKTKSIILSIELHFFYELEQNSPGNCFWSVENACVSERAIIVALTPRS